MSAQPNPIAEPHVTAFDDFDAETLFDFAQSVTDLLSTGALDDAPDNTGEVAGWLAATLIRAGQQKARQERAELLALADLSGSGEVLA